MAFHQVGVSAQQVRAHVCATKIKGVAKQCTKQRLLMAIPTTSDL